MRSNTRRDVQDYQSNAVQFSFHNGKRQLWIGPIKDSASDELDRVVGRDSNESGGSIGRLVVDAQDNAATLSVNKTDCRIRQQLQGGLNAQGGLLELKQLRLQR